jgi:hypothetical protein
MTSGFPLRLSPGFLPRAMVRDYPVLDTPKARRQPKSHSRSISYYPRIRYLQADARRNPVVGCDFVNFREFP